MKEKDGLHVCEGLNERAEMILFEDGEWVLHDYTIDYPASPHVMSVKYCPQCGQKL